jgi:uncharacterized membrane protein YjfL (UPF0719 family)
MNPSLFVLGLAKVLFGIAVGAGGIFLASRMLHRLMGAGFTDADMRSGNTAVGALKAGGLIALGILFRPAVSATFNAMDLMYRDHAFSLGAAARVALYAVVYVALAMAVSTAVLFLGTFLFSHLTRHVDEVAEIQAGNVAPAVVLAAVMVVLALLTEPGLEMALGGLLPLPALGRGEVIAPS